MTLFRPLAAILNFAKTCKQTAVYQKLSKIKKFPRYFLHLMRCLTVRTIKIFEVPSPAHSLMHQQLIIYLSFIFARKWKRFQWNFGQVDVFQRSNSKFKQIWDSCGDLVCQEVFEVFEGTSDSPKVMNIEWKVAFVPNNYLLHIPVYVFWKGKQISKQNLDICTSIIGVCAVT